MGTPETAAVTLELLLQGPDPVVGVVTQPSRPAGRGQQSGSSSVHKVGVRCGIPVATPEKIRDSNFLHTIASWQPKIVVVVAYGRILPASLLNVAPYGCVNVHYSLLPKYRGAAPAAWTIINGDSRAGVTTMRLVEKMDAGPIYLQRGVPVAPEETTESLQAKLAPVGAQLLLETLGRLKEGSLQATEQDERYVTLAPLIKKEDGLIDWCRSAVEIERRVRGFTPWPSAYTYLQGKLLKIHRTRPLPNADSGAPGEIVRADAEGLWVQTGAGILSLEEVQLEGRRRIEGVAFIRGARIVAGERL